MAWLSSACPAPAQRPLDSLSSGPPHRPAWHALLRGTVGVKPGSKNPVDEPGNFKFL